MCRFFGANRINIIHLKHTVHTLNLKKKKKTHKCHSKSNAKTCEHICDSSWRYCSKDH